jgi:hypothetical protein
VAGARARAAAAVVGTVRAAGRAKGLLDELSYHFEGLAGVGGGSGGAGGGGQIATSVRLASVSHLACLLADEEARRVLRANGLARQVVAVAAAALEGPAHADLAFGVCTLLYLLFEDGARPNLDLVAEPVVHLLVHALALGHSAALALDPRIQPPKAAPAAAAIAAASSSLEERLQPHFTDNAARCAWSTAAGPPRTAQGRVTLHDLALLISSLRPRPRWVATAALSA